MSLIEALGEKHAHPVSEKTLLDLKLLLRAIGPPPFTIFAAPNKNHNLSLAAYKKKTLSFVEYSSIDQRRRSASGTRGQKSKFLFIYENTCLTSVF